MRTVNELLCFSSLCALTACGADDRPQPLPAPAESARDAGANTEPTEPPSLGANDDGGPPASAEGYPPGPYGEGNPEVGDVIENLRLIGYVDTSAEGLATEQPFEATTLGELRDLGPRYLLVHTAAVWCSSCRRAATDLGARSAEVVNAGGGVLELLVEGSSGGLPTQTEIASWVETYGLTSTTVAPTDERGGVVFPDREYAYVIDLDTMEVVWRDEGLYANPTIADVAVTAMLDQFL